jgi:hypothetical protein
MWPQQGSRASRLLTSMSRLLLAAPPVLFSSSAAVGDFHQCTMARGQRYDIAFAVQSSTMSPGAMSFLLVSRYAIAAHDCIMPPGRCGQSAVSGFPLVPGFYVGAHALACGDAVVIACVFLSSGRPCSSPRFPLRPVLDLVFAVLSTCPHPS